MSSQDVVKSVSKKLKYYFQIKRLEDGFDLSAPDCPKLDHPRLRARPTLMYDGLHDRPLKHYFSPHDVRCVLTQFKADGENKGREKTVKKNVHKHLKRYQFVRTPLAETYYCKPRNARERRIRAELTGFGTPLKKSSQPHKGGYPVLRSTPQKYLSKGEAYRIVNNASRLLVATESVGIGGEKNKKDKEEDNKDKKKEKKKSAPKRFESEDSESVQSERSQQRGGKKKSERNSRQEQDHNIYTYDPQGNKVYLTKHKKDDNAEKDDGEDDSTYGTRPSSSSPVTIEGEPADDRKVQPWLKQEMRKQKVKDDEKEYVRPHSSYTPAPPSTPPEGRGRPKSAAHAKKGRGRKNSDDRSDRDSDCKEAWEVRGLDDDEDSKASARSGDAQVQTGGDLLRDYDPVSQNRTRTKYDYYENNTIVPVDDVDSYREGSGSKGASSSDSRENVKVYRTTRGSEAPAGGGGDMSGISEDSEDDEVVRVNEADSEEEDRERVRFEIRNHYGLT